MNKDSVLSKVVASDGLADQRQDAMDSNLCD
jgi:hypothetical protein